MPHPTSIRARILLFIGILAVIVSVLSLCITHSRHRAATAEYQKRCSVYAVALASTSEAWLRSDDAQLGLPLLSLGVVYLRVSSNGEVVLDLRHPDFSSAQLPSHGTTSIAVSRLVRFENHWAIDVPVPHMLVGVETHEEEAVLVTMQFGIDASELIQTHHQITKLVILLSLVAWGVGSILVAWLLCMAGHKKGPTSMHAVPIADASRRLVAGNLTLLCDALSLTVGKEQIDLTPKQCAVLELLISAPGRAFSDQDILTHVWEESPYANSSDVKQQIYLIRKRLRAAGLDASAILVTVPGVGYKLAIATDDGHVDAASTDQPHDDHQDEGIEHRRLT